MKLNELIQQNNEKRKLLNEENEKYYTSMVVYLRTDLTLSEQHAEEVLMEMLDHMIAAQHEGKTAAEVFGHDPKSYADELIEQLPQEEKRDMVKFIGQLAFTLMGWFLVSRGLILLLFTSFTTVSTTVYMIPTLIILALIGLSVVIGVKLIFGLIRRSVFNKNANGKMDIIKAGLFGAVSFAVIIAANMFIPDFGPSFEFPASASLGAGGLMLLVSWLMKRNNK